MIMRSLPAAAGLLALAACSDPSVPRTAEQVCASLHVGQELRSARASLRRISRSIVSIGDEVVSIQLRGDDGRWRMCTFHHAGGKLTDLAVTDAPP